MNCHIDIYDCEHGALLVISALGYHVQWSTSTPLADVENMRELVGKMADVDSAKLRLGDVFGSGELDLWVFEGHRVMFKALSKDGPPDLFRVELSPAQLTDLQKALLNPSDNR